MELPMHKESTDIAYAFLIFYIPYIFYTFLRNCDFKL